MPVERAAGGTSLIDVLDRVLDKGIVIDAWVRVSLVGIELLTIEARVVIASVDTYLKYAEAIGATQLAARPQPAVEAAQAPQQLPQQQAPQQLPQPQAAQQAPQQQAPQQVAPPQGPSA